MFKTLAAVGALLASYGLLILGLGLFSTLLSLRTGIEGFPTAVTGLVMSAYFLGMLVGAREGVRVVARVGHIRAFAAFASVMSVTALAHVLFIEPVVWAAMRFLSGFCMAGMVMVTESWLNERATNTSRGQVMSLYMITNYFAAGCGQLLVPVGDPGSFELFSLASIIFSLALVPVLMTSASAPLPATGARVKLGDLYRTSPLGLMGVCCSGLINSVLFSLGPVFARGVGLSLQQTSLFMAVSIMGGLILQWPVGRLSDRVDRRWVLVGACGLTVLAGTGIILSAGASPAFLYATGLVYGGVAFTIYALSAAHTNDFAPPGRLVQVASGLLFAYGVGASAGPIVAATDYVKALPGSICRWLPRSPITLGTDGFGRSDGRQALRRFFEVDAAQIALATLSCLHRDGKIEKHEVRKARDDLGIDPEKPNPMTA